MTEERHETMPRAVFYCPGFRDVGVYLRYRSCHFKRGERHPPVSFTFVVPLYLMDVISILGR